MKVRYVVVLALVAGLLELVLVLPRTPASTNKDSIATFIEKHWHRPMPAQGGAPAGYSALETSLDAASCAKCHPAQYQDWSKSLHSHTMGAGLLWFHVMVFIKD